MRQILNNLGTGRLELVTLPDPGVEPGAVLIRTVRTLVSQGTEKMLVQFSRASLLEKARSQPDRVRQVFSKMKTDGILPTIESVRRRLDEPLPMGYCNAGTVIGVGRGVSGFRVGDRVASNGPHAEIVSVPQNLVVKVPDLVSDDAAAFTPISAIGLQGVRLGRPELGETFVVVGLGLVGQLTAQLLQAHGCHVIGFDFDRAKVALARRFGIHSVESGGEVDPVKWVSSATGGRGADGVIITASAKSDNVIAEAAQMSRKRGRVVLIGVVGLNINRADFYEKEITFQVSCSYGPGRYETAYEEKGLDYPFGFVRWTENRNFQAVLELMSRGALNVEPLITKRAPLERYSEIYDNMDQSGLASLIVYDDGRSRSCERAAGGDSRQARIVKGAVTTLRLSDRQFGPADGALAIVGAGNFTKATVMPALANARAPVKIIVSSGGVTGTLLAKKYNVPLSSTDFDVVLSDPEVRGVIITTRHNLHAEQTVAALRAGKHVLVEKPLCLTLDELSDIETVLAAGGWANGTGPKPTATVGFNRRFSPFGEKMKNLLSASSGPVSFVATINAGVIPLSHWVQDPDVGGGRLVGEACHFIDFAIFLTGSLIDSVSATLMEGTSDCASILLRHQNGSNSVVNYFANGHRELSKERVEVHADGRTLLLDNFRELKAFGFRSFSRLSLKQDKGHAGQFAEFTQRVRENGPALIPWQEISNGARATLAVSVAIAERRWVKVMESC